MLLIPRTKSLHLRLLLVKKPLFPKGKIKKMHAMNRKVLGAALAVSAATAGLGVATNASAETVWNFNMFGGKRAVTVAVEAVKDDLEKAGGGAFKFNMNYASALGPEKQIPENVKIGAYEAGAYCVGYYPSKFPLLSVMELPFLTPRDTAASAKVQEEVMQHPLIVAELKDRWNARYLAPQFLPAYEFMGNRRIETTADMKGVKMRISGLNARALQEFGAVPTMVTAPEGYTALDRGTIDMFGFPYSYAFGAYKLYEVSKYVTEGLGMNGFMCFAAVNIDSWNATPQKVRDALPASVERGTTDMLAAYEEADKKWIPIYKEKLEVVKIAPAVRAEVAKGAGKIWEEWVKEQEDKGRKGREMLDFVKATVAKYTK
jgi:TRAP-type C4-dicarboxylate transport system substrate-binding protein